MKKTELKEIVKEALVEILPEVLMMMNEQIQQTPSGQSLVEESKPDLDLIRSKYRDSKKTGGGDFYSESLSPSPTISQRSNPRPNNPKGVVNGEQFASGKGILEWFASQPPQVNNGEFKHTEKDMNDFISKKFGV